MPNTQQIGHNYEQKAADYLQQQGLTLVTRNFQCKLGEIDLIMRDGDYLVFVEVRYRSASHYGDSRETITYSKQRKLRKTAELYLVQQKLWEKIACRFDVIAIDENKQAYTIDWIKNAF